MEQKRQDMLAKLDLEQEGQEKIEERTRITNIRALEDNVSEMSVDYESSEPEEQVVSPLPYSPLTNNTDHDVNTIEEEEARTWGDES